VQTGAEFVQFAVFYITVNFKELRL